MIKVKFIGKYVGAIVKDFSNEEELDKWIEENMVEYDIMDSYEWVEGKWVQN